MKYAKIKEFELAGMPRYNFQWTYMLARCRDSDVVLCTICKLPRCSDVPRKHAICWTNRQLYFKALPEPSMRAIGSYYAWCT
jgi:hypothetical protein